MRRLIIAGIIACAGGCAAIDPPPQKHLASKPCELVAQSRMTYAGFNGYDAKDQQIVFRGAYADCVKWEAKGYEPPIP
jgi:hypothetical protein